MLDGRVYRTAFLPALVALFVAAFALADRPNPGRSPLPADVFDGARAFGNADASEPAPQSLLGMDKAFPDRTAGSADDNGLADLVARELAAPEDAGERPVFTVRRVQTENDYQTVIATRPGISERQIVVLADREALGRAQLSGTAALLELGRVFKSRELRKTLVLVSTTGGESGFEGAREWARSQSDAPIDGVIVLGDMAGVKLRKPWVVSWPAAARSIPLGLERTVQAAVRRETRTDPGGPHAVGQWVRRALPVTVSAQGPIGATGLPAVMISETGELGPPPGDRVSDKRLGAFGRSAVRAVAAIDATGPRDAPAFADAPDGIVTMRNVLSDWAVRLIIGSLLLPALLAGFDAFFRARRRRVPVAPWLEWLVVAALPLPAMWLWLRGLGALGVIDAPSGPVAPDRVPVQTSGIVALVSSVVFAALVTWGARFAVRSLAGLRAPAAEERNGRGRPAPGVDGLAVATALWIAVAAAIAWIFNPYAAALLVPAAHLWLFAACSWRGRAALLGLLGGLVVPVLALTQLCLALELAPWQLAWGAALGAMAGAGLGSALLFASLLAAAAGVSRVLVARRRIRRVDGDSSEAIRTRGPVSYAGPGSLGGTESALRR